MLAPFAHCEECFLFVFVTAFFLTTSVNPTALVSIARLTLLSRNFLFWSNQDEDKDFLQKQKEEAKRMKAAADAMKAGQKSKK